MLLTAGKRDVVIWGGYSQTAKKNPGLFWQQKSKKKKGRHQGKWGVDESTFLQGGRGTEMGRKTSLGKCVNICGDW